MKIIFNNIIPARGFSAINIFGVLFVRNGVCISERLINHERIHTEQMKELGYIFFYILYFFEWMIKLFIYLDSSLGYSNISFEREAYNYDAKRNYLSVRKRYAFIKYI
jgi:hypothetical protein